MRVYPGEGALIVSDDEARRVVHVMAQDEGVTVLSTDVPAEQNPDRPDVGDRVRINDKYGLICVYRDGNDTIGVVFDGDDDLAWDYVDNAEVTVNNGA
jgi:hypothetical protein